MTGLALKVLQPSDVRTDLDFFRCEPYGCTLTARSCTTRLGRALAAKTGDWRERPSGDYVLCRECPTGPAIASAIGAKVTALKVAKRGSVAIAPALPAPEPPKPAPASPVGSGTIPETSLKPGAPSPAAKLAPAPSRFVRAARAPRACGLCRKAGHRSTTCPSKVTPAATTPPTPAPPAPPRLPILADRDSFDVDEATAEFVPRAEIVHAPNPFAQIAALTASAKPTPPSATIDTLERTGATLLRDLRARESMLAAELDGVRASIARLRWAERSPAPPFAVGQVVVCVREGSHKGERVRVEEVQRRLNWSSGWGVRVTALSKKNHSSYWFRGVTDAGRFAAEAQP